MTAMVKRMQDAVRIFWFMFFLHVNVNSAFGGIIYAWGGFLNKNLRGWVFGKGMGWVLYGQLI
jgi:hypothetical protein